MRELPFDPDIINNLPSVELSEQDTVRAERIKDAVERLPKRQRMVVELTIWGRWTKAEIAEEMRCSRSYVTKLWQLAQRSLRETLDGLPEED